MVKKIEIKEEGLAETIEGLTENPAVKRVIDKLILPRSFKLGLIMSCFTAGIFAIVNGLIMVFNLGGVGWIIMGVVLASVGGGYIAKQLRQ